MCEKTNDLLAALKALVENPRPAPSRDPSPEWNARYDRYLAAFAGAIAVIAAVEGPR